MNSRMDTELRGLLRPYTRRIRAQRWIDHVGICAVVGVVAGILLLLLSFAVPIPNAPGLAALAAVVAGLFTGVALAVLYRVRPVQTAMEIDRHGFAERVQTLYALQGDDSAFARLQRADTVRALRAGSARERIPIVWPRERYLLAAAGVLAACVLVLLPGPQDGILQQRAEIRRVMREQVERVEVGMDLLQKDSALSQAQKAELTEQLRELAKELREGRDYREAVKQISDLQRRLDEAQRSQAADDLRSLLADQPTTAEIAEQMQRHTAEQAMGQAVREAHRNGTQGDLAKALREAAGNAGDERLQEALNKLANALEAGGEAATAQAVQELQDTLDAAGDTDSLSHIGDQLALAKSRMGRLSQGDAPGGDSATDTQSGQGDRPDQDGNATSQGQPSGALGGQGGLGQGSGGSGQDDSDGSTGESGGAGAGSGDLVDAEKVYGGRRLDSDGVQEYLPGEIDAEGPRQQAETGPGAGTLDGYIPYNDVAGEYAQDAINAARREELPPAVQDWVEGYFSALQE